MIKTIKELNEQTKEMMEPHIEKMDTHQIGYRLEKFQLHMRNALVSVTEKEWGTPYFVSNKWTILDDMLIVSFAYYTKEKEGINVIKKPVSFDSVQNKEHYTELFSLMKQHWEGYIELKAATGIIFVHNEYLDEKWVQAFQRIHPSAEVNKLYGETIEKKTGQTVFYAAYSDLFKERMEHFAVAMEVLEEVILEEPLLKKYKMKIPKLYEHSMELEYAGKQLSVFFTDPFFQEIEFVNMHDKTMVRFPVDKEKILTYLFKTKEGQRLTHLFDAPRVSYEELLMKLGAVGTYALKHRHTLSGKLKQGVEFMEKEYNELLEFNDWETIEGDMSYILSDLAEQKNITPRFHQENLLKKQEIILHTFSISENFYYHFVFVRNSANELEFLRIHKTKDKNSGNIKRTLQALVFQENDI